ncbi:MAG: hypothetical protein WCF84_02170 [Anaerolineae bacterium]
MPTQNINPRQKRLNAICTKIAMFIVEETYTDEEEIQQKLVAAVKLLEDAGNRCAASDAKAAEAK